MGAADVQQLGGFAVCFFLFSVAQPIRRPTADLVKDLALRTETRDRVGI